MHTSQFNKIDGRDFRVLHNGDWSGEIDLGEELPNGRIVGLIMIPSDLVVAIAAEMVRYHRSVRLEQMPWHYILGVPGPGETELPLR